MESVKYEVMAYGDYTRIRNLYELIYIPTTECSYNACKFCTYGTSTIPNAGRVYDELVETANSQLRNLHGRLDIITSGSAHQIWHSQRLGLEYVISKASIVGIKEIYFEELPFFKKTGELGEGVQITIENIKPLVESFGIKFRLRAGIESFNPNVRKAMGKGFELPSIKTLANYYDSANILVGAVPEHTIDIAKNDIKIALDNFYEVNLSMFADNKTLPVQQDIVEQFMKLVNRGEFDDDIKKGKLNLYLNHGDYVKEQQDATGVGKK